MLRRLLLALGAALLVLAPRLAYALPAFVDDQAHVLSPATLSAVSNQLSALERDTTWEVLVATVRDDGAIERVAQDLFEKKKIGKKGKDNGVLILYQLPANRFRIHTGYHAESVIPDAVAKRIVMAMAEVRDKGDLNGAVVLGMQEVEKAIRAQENGTAAKNEPLPTWVGIIVVVAFLVLLILVLFSLFGGYTSWSSGGWGGGGWGGGGGGGGDSGGGGGDSGGGGASE